MTALDDDPELARLKREAHAAFIEGGYFGRLPQVVTVAEDDLLLAEARGIACYIEDLAIRERLPRIAELARQIRELGRV